MQYISKFISYSYIKYNLIIFFIFGVILFAAVTQYYHCHEARHYFVTHNKHSTFFCKSMINAIKVKSMVYQSYGTRFIACNHHNIGLNVTLYHYGIAYHQLSPGYYIVKAKLNQKSLSNPMRPLAFNMIRATKIKDSSFRMNYYFIVINSWRYATANKLWLEYGPSQILAILIAITFGIRCYLNKQSWHLLQYTGTSHMISLAGLHIGVIIITTQYIIKKVSGLLPRSTYDNPITLKYTQLILTLFMLLIYLLVTGASIPCSRAFYMVTIYLLIELMGINISLSSILIMSSLCIALFSQQSVFTISFVMSYYIMSFILFSNIVNKNQSLIMSLIKLQITITIACIPLSFYYFNNYSVIGCFVNLLAVPCLELIFMPLSLLLLISIGLSSIMYSCIVQIYILCLSPFLSMLAWASKLPFATIAYHSSLSEFLIQTVFIGCLLAPKASYHKCVVLTINVISLIIVCLTVIKSSS